MAAPRGMVHSWRGRLGGRKSSRLYPYLKTSGNTEGVRWDEILRFAALFGAVAALLIFLNSPPAPADPLAAAPTLAAFSTQPIVSTPLPFGVRASATPAAAGSLSSPAPTLTPTLTPTPTLTLTPTITPTWICPLFDPSCAPGKYDLVVVTRSPSSTPSPTPTITPTPTRAFQYINGCCLAYWNGRGWEVVPTPYR